MIHPTAIVHENAQVHDSAEVGPYAIIDAHVTLGSDCVVGPHVHLTGHTTIGCGNLFHAGCVIGDAPQDMKYDGDPTRLIVGERNTFREHVTIHRSNTLEEDTFIGSENMFMANSHVGHNSVVGNKAILANGALVGGHAMIGDGAFLSGNAVVHQFCRVGSMAMMQGGVPLKAPVAGIAMGMIEEGDKIAVAVSGGKDSATMLYLLEQIRSRRLLPFDFDFVAVHLDQEQPGHDPSSLKAWVEGLGIEYHLVREDTYSIVTEKTAPGKTYCSLCSRLRRGSLYGFAEEIGATKVALGHHREDILETLFLNMFYGGTLKAMPPKLLSDDGKNIVIRPLAYCKEADIAEFARLMEFPIIPCNLCGSQPNLQRQVVKVMARISMTITLIFLLFGKVKKIKIKLLHFGVN